ncbi:MAG TPA: TIM barrel protein [Phycisphaerales bacterium]|nr:TIM barrel protein [Phycisphaerales bacterium]
MRSTSGAAESTTGAVSRREALGVLGATLAIGGPVAAAAAIRPKPGGQWFDISLAQWSLHRELHDKKLDAREFPAASKGMGFGAVEYVNSFYREKAGDGAFWKEMRGRCDDLGVRSVLIMCDVAEKLGDENAAARQAAVDVHRPWLDAAKTLGCHAIRVNLQCTGPEQDQQKHAAEGLRALVEVGAGMDLSVIVENHGGKSSDGAWLSGVMKLVDHPRCGTLPDFGNWYEYDRYKGIKDLLPFAKGLSAKSYDFDETGEETTINYSRMLKLARLAGYTGFIGVEYEGNKMPEREGILATKRLLEQLRDCTVALLP